MNTNHLLSFLELILQTLTIHDSPRPLPLGQAFLIEASPP